MRKIYNYIMIAALALAAVGCIDEIGNADIPTAETGDEVQFGLSLPDAKTRTVYGDESGNAFPIYWVAGDKVQIFSPQCLEGRRSAEYEVTLPDEGNAYYAKALTKTGETGVQWGDNDKAVFYSLYPSGNYSLSEDGTQAKNIVINYSQNIIVDGDEVKSDMEDCLMYAKNDGGEENNYEGVPKGETVNLHYDPISTVFMVTLNVPSNSADDFTIQSVSLIATKDIAGTFNLNISNGSFAGWGNNKSATVTAQIYDKTTGGFYTLTKGNHVEIPLFIAPIEGLDTNGWKIRVVANNTEYLKTLGNQDIVGGKIHKVTLPNLSTEKEEEEEEEEEEWDVSQWMTYIPRNVYLSEVSIPGSWNSLNPDFQTQSNDASATILAQYNLGVRAFHLETRWQADGTWIFVNPTGVLGIAVGGNTLGGSTDKYMPSNSANSFDTVLKAITGNVKDDEYIVVICSFAQNSAEYDGANGWIKKISAICESNEKVIQASTIGPDTLVGDVLGKVIVIVNAQDDISSTTSSGSVLAESSKCFFTYMPSELTAANFDVNNSSYVPLWATDASSAIASGISIYNTQAQVTSDQDDAETGFDTYNNKRGYAPSIKQRKAILETILKWSKSNYNATNYAHDKWIYLGLGGYQVSEGDREINAISSSYAKLAGVFNTWIQTKINEMGEASSGETNVPYYPIGIVLMNNVADYSTVVKDVLLLNNKYRLQYDPSKPAFPTITPKSAAASYSSGMQDTGTSAFGWE